MKKNDHLKKWNKKGWLALLGCVILCLLAGCSSKKEVTPFQPQKDSYLKESDQIDFDKASLNAIPDNPNATLSVPTYITKIRDTYFIVDCYHNQVIYHDNLTDPLYEWQIMISGLGMPHTIASDGTVYVIDDTENDRILVMEEAENENLQRIFIPTQEFTGIGDRPHYVIYHEEDQTFYVWSSESGEMFLFRRDAESSRLYLTEIRRIESLAGCYVRSFTIRDDRIYFVSGTGSAKILEARLSDFKILKEYPVPASMAGMVQLSFIGSDCYLTISTDQTGNQEAATMIRVKDLKDLQAGKYEDVYASFIGGGTPYYITRIEDNYYLTEHRLPGHSIWSFQVDQETGKISATTVY